MKKIGNSHGITLVSLVVTIVVMLILTISITTSVTSTLELQKYNKVKEDIIALSEEVKIYYMKNAKLPVYTDKTFDLVEYNVPSEDTNPNDSGAYYAIDLSVLSTNLEINCGNGNKDKDLTTDDLYVLNEESLTVYYLKGAILNGIKHYTIIDDFSGGSYASEYYKKADLPIISVVTIESNGSDKTKATKDDIVTLKFLSNYDYTTKPTVTIDGQDVTAQCQWNGRLCTVNYKVASIKYLGGDSKVGEKVEFSISNYTADDRTGKEITDVTFGQNVYFSEGYVVDGVEIPRGFVYVGGTKDSGLVISDNASDKDKYKNREVVGTDLVGNQYVWVPCTTNSSIDAIQFARTEWDVEDDSNTKASKDELTLTDSGVTYTDADTSNGITADVSKEIVAQIKAEKASVTEHGGFYIGRYEVGKIGDTAVIKANQTPYSEVTWSTAYNLAKKMKAGSTTTSYLCSSYAWDTAINFIEKNSTAKKYATTVEGFNGNWYTQEVVDGQNSVIKEANTEKMLNTGLTTAYCNIFDMGGNELEYTTEINPGILESIIARGGTYHKDFNDLPAGQRLDTTPDLSAQMFGIRTTLFLN